jgi:hypothetical protein
MKLEAVKFIESRCNGAVFMEKTVKLAYLTGK